MSSETGEANIIQIFYRINNKFQPKRAVLTQRFENVLTTNFQFSNSPRLPFSNELYHQLFCSDIFSNKIGTEKSAIQKINIW